MMKKGILLFFGIITMGGCAYSQITGTKVTNVKSTVKGDSITISYTLPAIEHGKLVDVRTFILDSANGQNYRIPSTVSGIGPTNIGGTHTIEWDYKTQTDSLSPHYSIQIMASRQFVGGRGASNALFSLIASGIGNFFVRTHPSVAGPIIVTTLANGLYIAGIIAELNPNIIYNRYFINSPNRFFSYGIADYMVGAGMAMEYIDLFYVLGKGISNRYRFGKMKPRVSEINLHLGISQYGLAIALSF